MPEGKEASMKQILLLASAFYKIFKLLKNSHQEVSPRLIARGEWCRSGRQPEDGDRQVWVNFSHSCFTLLQYFSALQSRLGTDDRWGNEVGMKSWWGDGHSLPFTCITVAGASVTAGCGHQVEHRTWGRTGVCTTKHIAACQGGSGFYWKAALTHPSLSASKLTYWGQYS